MVGLPDDKWGEVVTCFIRSLLMHSIQPNCMLIATSIWLGRKNQRYGVLWMHFP